MWCIFGTYAPERNKLPPPPPSPRTMQRTFRYGYEYKPNPAQKWWQFWKQGFVQMRFEMNPGIHRTGGEQ